MDESEATIPQMVEDVRKGKLTRRRLITTLTAMGISTVGVGAIVAASAQQQSSTPAPQTSHPAQKQHEHL